ncbi:MAG TPA: hypothetical protein VLX31_01020 [Streptosporangiaceae bacterium]|nr:hypothetical protein [Streptosporangiaceae bacterium]
MNRLVSKSEATRLGKRGSYRLGGLAQQGVGRPAAPRPFRPSFTRAYHAGPAWAWVLGAVAGTGLVAAGAAGGLWFMPMVVGLAAGVAVRWGGWRLRVSTPVVAAMAAAGWGLALWIPALSGLPVGATARTIAALAGLPPYAAVAVGVTLAVSALQGLAGLWLGRALAPRPPEDEIDR